MRESKRVVTLKETTQWLVTSCSVKTIVILLLLLTPFAVSEAHPGRTAADGCHYCRTNCSRWGVAWNDRHCHGSYSAPSSSYNSPSSPTTPPERKIGTDIEYLVGFPVVEVIDGDTIKIEDVDDSIETVRLIGIDTPETVHTTKPVECFGQEASTRLKVLLEGKSVYLQKDSVGDTRDQYGRLLRYVYVRSAPTFTQQDVNALMIHEGYAYAYTIYPFEKRDEYVALQHNAEFAQRGLWQRESVKKI